MGKITKSIILSALFLALASTGTLWGEETMPDLGSASTDDLSMDAEPQMPGRLDSTGIYFEVKDSEWLNVSLSSSELIKLTLESVPNMITMHIEAAAGAASTQITIGGLAPDTTYHKYEDNYHNHEAFTTDSNGSYNYTQDLSSPHTVFIQTGKSTKFIRDNATGGDCYSIGVWDSPTKTCTMTTDLNEAIQIDSDGVTLNGNGRTLTGGKTGNGVYIYRRTGVTIKNLNITMFAYGIYLRESSSISLTNNYASNNNIGIYLSYSTNNTLINNITNSNRGGINIQSSANNTLSGNTMSGNSSSNFSIGGADDLHYDNTIDTSNLVEGKPIYYIRNASDQTYDATTNAGAFYCIKCNNVTIDGLSITTNKKNSTGIYLWKTQKSTIKNVILSNNSSGIYILYSTNNIIANNTISDNRGIGLLVRSSTNNALMDNTILSSSTGIWLWGNSNSNYLAGNNASNNTNGIILSSSSSNTLIGNDTSNNTYGISLGSSNNNILTGNSSSSNTYGISLSHSSYNTLFNNTMSDNNIYNFNMLLQYDEPEVSYDNNIDTSNLVDGKPIYYIRNASDQTYDATTNAGVFYCINCNNVTVDGLTLSNNLVGVLLWKTQNSNIRNVTASHVGNGIHASYSSGNVFEGNNLSSDTFGISVISADNCILRNNNTSNNAYGISFSGNGNTLTGNTGNANFYYGIGLWGSSNIVTENTLSNSHGNYPFGGGGYGIYAWGGNNTIYNNNLIANARQTYGSGSIFSLPAPIGGNYWSDYDSPSEGCYDSNNDGFCDSPYVFYGGQDNLPWTKPNGWKPSDSIAPTTTVSSFGTSGNNSWYLSDVQVTLTAADNEGGSGVAKTEYSFDGTNWTAYSAPFMVSAEGTTTVYYKSVDSAGNTETAKSLTVSIDKTLPTITGRAATSPNANGWYNTDVTVHFTASDNVSGIDTVTPDITISSEGANQSATGTAFDKAGNSASATVTGINIDKTAPVITITSPAAIQYDRSTTINISFTATDNVSGIYKTTVYLDGQQYDPANPISLLYLPLGTHTLMVESENYAGLSASQSVGFEIIATASGTTLAITTLYQTGAIDSAGIVTSLTRQLQAAQAAISSGQTASAQNILEAFINLLDAQSAKHISSSAAEILMADALYMIGQL